MDDRGVGRSFTFHKRNIWTWSWNIERCVGVHQIERRWHSERRCSLYALKTWRKCPAVSQIKCSNPQTILHPRKYHLFTCLYKTGYSGGSPLIHGTVNLSAHWRGPSLALQSGRTEPALSEANDSIVLMTLYSPALSIMADPVKIERSSPPHKGLFFHSKPPLTRAFRQLMLSALAFSVKKQWQTMAPKYLLKRAKPSGVLLRPVCISRHPPSVAALWPSDKWSSQNMTQTSCSIPNIQEKLKDSQQTTLRQGRKKMCLCICIRHIIDSIYIYIYYA